MLDQINNNIQFTYGETSNKTSFFRYNDKQKWYKYLDGLQQNNTLKIICPIYAKRPMTWFNKYTVFSCKKNMSHC